MAEGTLKAPQLQKSVVRGVNVGDLPANNYVTFVLPTYNLVSGYVNVMTTPNLISWIVSRISSVIGGTEIRVMNTNNAKVSKEYWDFYYTTLN